MGEAVEDGGGSWRPRDINGQCWWPIGHCGIILPEYASRTCTWTSFFGLTEACVITMFQRSS